MKYEIAWTEDGWTVMHIGTDVGVAFFKTYKKAEEWIKNNS